MNNFIKRILSSIIIVPIAFYSIYKGSLTLIFFTAICFIIACYEWHMMTKNKSYKIYGLIFLVISFYTFYQISIEFLSVFFVILICVSTDVGGYCFGKFFKGPKLTKISPNKTYAGMIGGYFLSLFSLLIIINIMDYNHIITRLFLISILISTVSQVGDIIISYFKRLSKIKNTGKIIPGHGGLLDRIDGMLFALPFAYIYLNLIQN